MAIPRLIVPSSLVIALFLALACSASEPPEELKDETEGVFIEAPETPSDLAMYRGGPARTGVYKTKGVLEQPEAKWVFNAFRSIRTSAVVVEDKVLFGNDDGIFYALDAETGTTAWSFEATRQIRVSPLAANGVVYFGDDNGYMSALNLEDGEVLWQTRVRGGFRSSPVIAGGTIYIGNDNGFVYANDGRTGLTRWEVKPTEGHIVRTSPAAVEDNIYVVSTKSVPRDNAAPRLSSTMLALDQDTGDEVWSYQLEGFTDLPVAVGGRAVFVATFEWVGTGSRIRLVDGRLYAIELSSGEPRWFIHEEEIGTRTAPALTDELVLWVLDDGRLLALDIMTGEVEWEYEAGSRVFSSPSVADGLVYFGTFGGKVVAVDLVTGQKRWEFQTEVEGDFCDPNNCDRIINSPVISDGVLYIGNNAGYFYALEAGSTEEE